MIRTILVDDEELILQLLKEMLCVENNIDVVGVYTKPEEALVEIIEKKPDLVFLDIEMPSMNGIELATEILNSVTDIDIVFVTAYNQYAVEAFKLNAMHYILKPPSQEELQIALDRANKNIQEYKKEAKQIYIRLLGGISVCDEKGNSLIKWRTGKAEELFALLIISGKKGIEKWRIIDKLWPEANNSKKSEQLLYSTIYRVKKALIQAGVDINLDNRLGVYSLNIDHVWCDVYELEKWYMNNNKDEHSCEKIFNLYKGELFSGKDYEWGLIHRSAMYKMAVEICDSFEEGFKKNGQTEKADMFHNKRKILIEE